MASELLHWCAELEGDSILSSEYLLMKLILGQEDDRTGLGPDRRTLLRIANHLRLVQRPDGSWGQYPGSPPDVSACVKAYFALKAFGDSPEAAHMTRARARILELGGAEQCNTFSTFYLACLGQVSWEACPAIPPEIALLPRWFPFHMDKVAAWTRTMILPLALCSGLRPVRKLPHELGIDELFIDHGKRSRLTHGWDRIEPLGWRNFFLACDRLLKVVQRRGLSPVRRRAIMAAEAWILERMRPETTEGLGAIFPPMVYVQIAFQALGYQRTHPVIRQAERDLDDFFVDAPHADPRRDHVRIQPCFSPVWDSGIALYAMTEAGLTTAGDERIALVCDWLRSRQVTRVGDWARNLRPEDRGMRLGPDGEGTAWAFEYVNEWYPDVDDTAMVAKALWRAGDRPGETVNRDTARRAARWLIAMQNADGPGRGGWAAFDRTKDRPWMEAVPFADHNAMQDPSCADITGRVLEALVTCGVSRDHPCVRAGVEYILRTQEPEGCWWGRWGVNYLYGTWQALGGLTHAGVSRGHSSIRRAIDWVLSVQREDGGFGESANTYLDRGLMGGPEGTITAPSTPSQTAWGLMCLMYALPRDHPAVGRAGQWLMEHQLADDKAAYSESVCVGYEAVEACTTADPLERDLASDDWQQDLRGGWAEHFFTGTGFPKVFYLRYNLYRHYFPVMALGRWRGR